MTIITLTTDFGDKDGYIGMLKGVIYAINPAALLVDITHQLEPQNILQGAFMLHTTHRHFPPGTIHVAVVDPGVGTSRRAICLEVPEVGYFVGPDNGLFSYILEAYPNTIARELINPAYHRQLISKTFHGRDIFAPVAAFLGRGEPFEEVGPQLELSGLVRLENLWPAWEQKTNGKRLIKGKIIHIDNFGNLISNIHRRLFAELSSAELERLKIGIPLQITATGIKDTYGNEKKDTLIALFGSSDFLELARVNGRADSRYGEKFAKIGEKFHVRLES